jgi:hypothetical protein
MDAFDFNGGNGQITRGDSNLENVMVSVSSENQFFEEENKLISEEVNGDLKTIHVKKNISPLSKKRLRKFKTSPNITEDTYKSLFVSVSPNLNKRKTSDIDDVSSGESEEFNGFDLKDPEIFESGSIILKKLIGN